MSTRLDTDRNMADTDTTRSKPFRAIIVGAGIVGLTLSHALQLAKIDHVVLEEHDKLKSVKGAALILWLNAERIFDQFGFMQNILKTTTPVITEHRRWSDGTINGSRSTMHRFQQLFGVAPVLFDRQSCVAHLYDNFPYKSTVRLNKRRDYRAHQHRCSRSAYRRHCGRWR
ncbi:uncharacterized protein M421DRAFT_111089 [Didymella exigua CBS 183.55]|uniref:FAD-binding domain-containing protein n=1 Tax=Didymella exigua CBS 183.55 TaxID=1150837 RepID=A0A6A5S037_9PLEO|nr:uncharacterized protein M421DRAFT_111089 [Didymella exigua CBS 183.55]KAF1934041.1 hypothetical protein M421DRAFT_111089 [Didymella exigua CBS 183.55]